MRSSMARGGIHITSDTLTPGIVAFPPKLHAAVAAVMQYHEGNVQDAARDGAPWTDRTSNARNGLFARAYSTAKAHGIVLYHTMPYGIWLEVRWGGKYRIIVPTIQRQGALVMRTLQGVLRKMN